MRYTNRDIAVMGALIALNVGLGGIVYILKLPIYLDAIGTILAAVLLSLPFAIAVGVVSFLIAAAILSPVYIWFVGTQAIIAIYIYFAASVFGALRSLPRVVITGLLLGVVTSIASAPVIVYVFGGVAGSGRDLLTVALLSTGQQIYNAVLLSGAASEPVDKLLQTLAAYFILQALPGKVIGALRNPRLDKNGFLQGA